ncbi:hypothetical protein T492DRAFT_898087 [Pavlovales sp. CCMP2436]|nr:hypothetical protein T492DRAFT_898087 [Pavlovales sp. CCMP2436]
MDVTELRHKADQGDAEAQYALAGCHYHEQNVPQDYAEAATLFRRAADQGHLDAQYNYGCCYRDGRGVPQDDREAARLFRRATNNATNNGHADAQCALADCYDLGRGMPLDHDEAARLYRRAAEQGNPTGGERQDDREAARLFGLAAEQGIAATQFDFAVCCELGKGVPQDLGEAACYCRLAAEQGDADAQTNFAGCCEHGRGVPQDDADAARYFRLAAEQGHVKARLNLGMFCELGKGMPQDAARFLAQAAQQTGDEEIRLEALAALSEYAHEPDVIKACCVGCGKTRKLRACSKCLTAKFFGAECIRRMWPVHKQSCKTFAAGREEAAAAADGGADEHGAAPAARIKWACASARFRLGGSFGSLFNQSFHRAPALRPEPCTRTRRLQRFVFGFLIIHHFYQLPTSATPLRTQTVRTVTTTGAATMPTGAHASAAVAAAAAAAAAAATDRAHAPR